MQRPLPDTNIVVDYFGPVRGGPHVYFLTHTHADHLTGLSNQWGGGFIYCSPVCCKLLLQKFPHLQPLLVPLELNQIYRLSTNEAKLPPFQPPSCVPIASPSAAAPPPPPPPQINKGRHTRRELSYIHTHTTPTPHNPHSTRRTRSLHASAAAAEGLTKGRVGHACHHQSNTNTQTDRETERDRKKRPGARLVAMRAAHTHRHNTKTNTKHAHAERQREREHMQARQIHAINSTHTHMYEVCTARMYMPKDTYTNQSINQ
mmetsp:Transcript_30189/g.87720  ORF Transcript_30189/g.87720 Transcript_30189/m.87720 type:complete len:260 (-) Transcript_30189:191-970(-)